MSQGYDYSYEWDSRYCYPFSHVLKNKLGIEDADKLGIAEREITSLRIANAKINPIEGNFDLKHLQAIHRYIFSDLYEWAGELRWVNIAKGNMFCNYEYIETNADQLFAKLQKEKNLTKTSQEEMPYRLSYYLGEINVLHPFREGNGRTQRLFIEYLAENAGFNVDFSQISPQEMIEASAEAFACDYTKMDKLFVEITTLIQEITIKQELL